MHREPANYPYIAGTWLATELKHLYVWVGMPSEWLLLRWYGMILQSYGILVLYVSNCIGDLWRTGENLVFGNKFRLTRVILHFGSCGLVMVLT